MTHLLRIVTTVRKRKVPITGIKIIKMRKDDRDGTGNKNQMNGNSGQAPQQDGLYHYSYMNNRGDSRFDRPSTNASQQTQNVQDAQSAQNNQTAGVHGSAQNAQTAGAQSSSQNAQTVGTQNASYSGFQRNVNGMEAWYDSQRMNQGYQNQAGNPMNNMGTGKPSDNNMRQKKAKDKKPKNRKSGFGKKAAGVVAAAVVFGLVAGVVFQGVRYGSDKLLGKDSQTTTEQSAEGSTENNAPQLKQASSDTTSTVYDVSTVAKKVMPSIVSITGTYVTTYDYWFNSYQQESTGAGSGIIIGKDDQYLYLATNYHVVQNAKSLSVTFVDDKSADAVVKGYVENNDIAVVTVKLSDISDDTLNEIKEIQVGSSDDLAVGDPCVAIGNALGYGQSVTVGYISALNREISASDETVKVLQTDAAINPGNSGGALVNMQGELIGINTAKYSDTSVEGMGYALPISDVQDIINDLIAGKNVSNDGTTSGQAYLGISAQTITSQYAQLLNMPEGVYISSVEQGSAAEECGLQSGDIICSLDGEDIADMETFHDKIVACNPGDKVTIVYYRNNNGNYEKQTATATLKEKQ